MKAIRTVKPKMANTYNELAKHVNNKETVIYIDYSTEFGSKCYKEVKKGTKLGTVGGILFTLAFLINIPLTLAVAAPTAIYSIAKDDLRSYNPVHNKDKNRLELYLKFGKNKYDKKHDEIVE